MDFHDCPIALDECTFTPHELLGWFYLIRKEGDNRHRKHMLRIAVQHNLMPENLATVLAWAFGLESA